MWQVRAAPEGVPGIVNLEQTIVALWAVLRLLNHLKLNIFVSSVGKHTKYYYCQSYIVAPPPLSTEWPFNKKNAVQLHGRWTCSVLH